MNWTVGDLSHSHTLLMPYRSKEVAHVCNASAVSLQGWFVSRVISNSFDQLLNSAWGLIWLCKREPIFIFFTIFLLQKRLSTSLFLHVLFLMRFCSHYVYFHPHEKLLVSQKTKTNSSLEQCWMKKTFAVVSVLFIRRVFIWLHFSSQSLGNFLQVKTICALFSFFIFKQSMWNSSYVK